MAEHFGVSVPEIINGFGWLTYGLLLGAVLAIYVVGRLPLRLVQLCMFVGVAAALLTLRAIEELLVVKLLLGVTGTCLGIGLAGAAATIAGTFVGDRRASMLVITDAFFSIAGWVCAALTLRFIGQSLHWSAGYVVVAFVALVVVMLAAVSEFPAHERSTARSPVQTDSSTSTAMEYWPVGVWLCVGALCLYTLGQYAMLWWLPQHLQISQDAAAQDAGLVVGRFWAGMFAAQLFVSRWVLKVGVQKLVLVACSSAFLSSLPLWWVVDLSLIPWLGALWGFGNLAFLKIGLSFATELLSAPSPRLVSALLFGATSGTAISPFVTSNIVSSHGTLAVLQFSSACYFGIVVLMLLVRLFRGPLTRAQ